MQQTLFNIVCVIALIYLVTVCRQATRHTLGVERLTVQDSTAAQQGQKVNLFIGFYNDKDSNRQLENDFCLLKNIANPLIDNIYVLLDNDKTILPGFLSDAATLAPIQLPWSLTNQSMNETVSNKLHVKNVAKRPTFRDFFQVMNSVSQRNDVNIIANCDIFFDDTLQLVKDKLKPNQCYALARWEIQSDDTLSLCTLPFSQDTWMLSGPISPSKLNAMNIDFYQGLLACDMRIAYELKSVGYDVVNPSRTIKTYHMHKTQVRNYSESTRVHGKTLEVPITTLEEIESLYS